MRALVIVQMMKRRVRMKNPWKPQGKNVKLPIQFNYTGVIIALYTWIYELPYSCLQAIRLLVWIILMLRCNTSFVWKQSTDVEMVDAATPPTTTKKADLQSAKKAVIHHFAFVCDTCILHLWKSNVFTPSSCSLRLLLLLRFSLQGQRLYLLATYLLKLNELMCTSPAI